MADRDALREAIAKFENILNRSWSFGGPHFEENRREAIQLRRDISAQISTIAALGASIEDTAWHNAFRSEFSKMRSAMNLHHASWPVVAIELDNPDYLASAQVTREANHRFIVWVRATLSHDPG